MLHIIFHPDVEHEVKASYEFYQNQSVGLGDNYLNELEAAYQAIVELPDTWPKFQKNLRRFLLSKFPFSVIYQFNHEKVFIVAVMHNSRKPDYWKERTYQKIG